MGCYVGDSLHQGFPFVLSVDTYARVELAVSVADEMERQTMASLFRGQRDLLQQIGPFLRSQGPNYQDAQVFVSGQRG